MRSCAAAVGRRAGLHDPPEVEAVEPVRAVSATVRRRGAGAPAGAAYGHDGAAAAPATRLDHPGRPQGRDRLAQGRPRDVHPLGELALGRSVLPVRVDAQPDRGRELLDAGLEGVVTADRPQHDLGEVGRPAVGADGVTRVSVAGARLLSMVWLHTEFSFTLYD